jgi:hypothetical protein
MAYDQDYRSGVKTYGYEPCFCSATICTCDAGWRRKVVLVVDDPPPVRERPIRVFPRVKDWEQRESKRRRK